jgi:hypothetical protein
MGVVVHRVISVTGPADATKAAHDFISAEAPDDTICFIGPLFQQINGTDTFCIHSNGSKSGYEEERSCTTFMNEVAKWLGSAERLQFVDVSYSKDRHMDAGDFTRIENATYKNRETEDA